jgi:hypothetical protein
MAKQKNNVIKFPKSKSTSRSTGGNVSKSLVHPGKPDKPSDLVNLVCLLPLDPTQAGTVAACNWASFKGFRWDTKPTNNSTYWALFPIDYDGADLIREANWYALQDTLSAYSQWQVKFMVFKHPETTCLRVLGLQVGYDPTTITPAFRLFMNCVPQLQKNEVIDEEIYRETWEDALAEQIRKLGALYANPDISDTTTSTYGAVKTGWPVTVLRHLMLKQPQLLASDPGKLPVLSEIEVLRAMRETNVLARELTPVSPQDGLLVET